MVLYHHWFEPKPALFTCCLQQEPFLHYLQRRKMHTPGSLLAIHRWLFFDFFCCYQSKYATKPYRTTTQMAALVHRLGLQWTDVGGERPVDGSELHSAKLAEALAEKNTFTRAEFQALGVSKSDLVVGAFIKVGDVYFQVGDVPPSQGCLRDFGGWLAGGMPCALASAWLAGYRASAKLFASRDLIRGRDGELIDPRTIELALREHPDIDEVVAFAWPLQAAGGQHAEHAVAIAMPAMGPAVELDELRIWAHFRLSPAQMPQVLLWAKPWAQWTQMAHRKSLELARTIGAQPVGAEELCTLAAFSAAACPQAAQVSAGLGPGLGLGLGLGLGPETWTLSSQPEVLESLRSAESQSADENPSARASSCDELSAREPEAVQSASRSCKLSFNALGSSSSPSGGKGSKPAKGKVQFGNLSNQSTQPKSPAEVVSQKLRNNSFETIKWTDVGGERPVDGSELHSAKLAEALAEKNTFTRAEFQAFDVPSKELDSGSFIQVGTNFFQINTYWHARQISEDSNRKLQRQKTFISQYVVNDGQVRHAAPSPRSSRPPL